MGLCGGESAKKKKQKTIIIPKGVVDSKKDYVLEIPAHLVDANSNLVVKASGGPNSTLFVEPYDRMFFANSGEVSGASAVDSMTAMTDPFVMDPLPQNAQSATNRKPTPAEISMTAMTDPYVMDPQNEPKRSSTKPVASSTRKGENLGVQTDFSWGTQQIVVQTTQPETSQNLSTGSHKKHKLSSQLNQITCPICSQTSCRYIRPYSNLLNQLTPTYSRATQDFDEDKIFGSSMKSVRSEIICRAPRVPKQVDETALLNKLLDEKVDKILKPILHSLAKALPVDEEREIATKTSYGSLESRYSRERYPRKCYAQRSTEYVRSKSTSSRTRRCPELDYDDGDDQSPMKTSPSPDSYGSRRKNVALDENLDLTSKNFQKCPSPSLCYTKRGSVNFEPTT